MTNAPTAVDPDLISTVTQFFSQKSDHETVARAEAAGLLDDLWSATEDLGLPLVGIDENRGGSGGSLFDTLAVLQSAAAYAVPLPLAETYLAGWLLAGAGIDVPAGPLTIVPPGAAGGLSLKGDRIVGSARGVPWARHAGTIVALVDGPDGATVVAFGSAEAEIEQHSDLAGQPLDALTVDAAVSARAPSLASLDDLFLRGALVRSAQIAGGLESISELTRSYVNERVQFGRPVGKFQAVQQHVVILAQRAVMTTLSVTRAAQALSVGDGSFEICSLKLVANQNAIEAVRSAHQAHGAIGMTQEYRLQQLTRRLNSWLLDFGTEKELAPRLGAVAADAESFAAVVTATDGTVSVAP